MTAFGSRRIGLGILRFGILVLHFNYLNELLNPSFERLGLCKSSTTSQIEVVLLGCGKHALPTSP
jgi:hypothetical protein